MGIFKDTPGPGEYTPRKPDRIDYNNVLPGLQLPVDKKQPHLTQINDMKKHASVYVGRKKHRIPKSYSQIMRPVAEGNLMQRNAEKYGLVGNGKE